MKPSSGNGFGDKTKDVLPEAIPVLESLQPYTRGAAFKDHPLWILNALCNIDKHRAIAIHSTNLPFRINGAVDIRVRDVGYAKEVSMALGDRFRAQFDPDPLEIEFGKPIDGAGDFFNICPARLRPVHKFVRDDVIPAFVGFFK